MLAAPLDPAIESGIGQQHVERLGERMPLRVRQICRLVMNNCSCRRVFRRPSASPIPRAYRAQSTAAQLQVDSSIRPAAENFDSLRETSEKCT